MLWHSARRARPHPTRAHTPAQAHDEHDECNVGDTVRVHICRPLSRRKCWQVTQVLHRAKQFDAEAAARAVATPQQGAAPPPLGAPSFAASALTRGSSS